MKIVITGGAGFIGSALYDKLDVDENEIFVIDNLSFGNRKLISIPDNRFYDTDLLDRAAIVTAITSIQPDVIVHLAAVHFIPFCNEFPFLSTNINIVGTQNVLTAVAGIKKIPTILFASTAAVYSSSDEAHKECSELGPLDIYGLSKLAGEALCRTCHLETGAPFIVCRFFNAFGRNETNMHLIPEILNQLKEHPQTLTLGNLKPKRDYIHTTDLANALALLIENTHEGYHVYNIGSGTSYSVIDVISAFEAGLGIKIQYTSNADRKRKSDRPNLVADISKLTGLLNWKPTVTLHEGIKDLLIQTGLR